MPSFHDPDIPWDPGNNGRTGVMSQGFDGNVVYGAGQWENNDLPLGHGYNVRWASSPNLGTDGGDHVPGCQCATCDQ